MSNECIDVLLIGELSAIFGAVNTPTDFSEELDLYLYVSAAVQKHFDIAKGAVHKDTSYQLPEDWWSVWRCEHLVSDSTGEQHAVLFTNSATFFSFICRGFSDDFDALVSEFEGAFLNSLKAQGLKLPRNVSIQTRLIRGNPRRLVGTMKELKFYAMDRIGEPPADIEQFLAHRVCMSLKERRPIRAYLNQIETNPPFDLGFEDGDDDVIIQFPGA